MFQAAPPAKMMEDGKIHTVEHIINPIAVQQDPASAAAAAAAAAAAVIPAVSTPPPFQVSSAHESCFPYVLLSIRPASHTSCFPYVLLCIRGLGGKPGLLPCSCSGDAAKDVTVPSSPAVHLTSLRHLHFGQLLSRYGEPKSGREGTSPHDGLALIPSRYHLPFWGGSQFRGWKQDSTAFKDYFFLRSEPNAFLPGPPHHAGVHHGSQRAANPRRRDLRDKLRAICSARRGDSDDSHATEECRCRRRRRCRLWGIRRLHPSGVPGRHHPGPHP